RHVHHLILITLLVLLTVEPTVVGIGSEDSSVDLARWVIRLLTYGLAFGAFLLWRPGPIRAPLGWLLAAAVALAAVAPWGANPLGDALVGFGIVAMVLYAAVAVDRLGFDRVMLVTLLVLTAVVAIGGLVSVGDPRWSGLSGGANGYGIQGALIVVLAVHRWLRSTSPLWLAFVPIGLVAAVASDSRVALLAIGVGVFMLVRDLLPPLSAVLVLLVVVAGLVSTASSNIASDVAVEASRSGEAEEITTLTGRTDIWESSLDAIRQRPLTGWGITGVRPIYSDAVVRGELAFEAQDAHNVLVQVALVGGIAPAVLLLAAALSYLVGLSVSTNRLRDALVAMVVLHGLTEAVIGSEPRLLFFVFATALASAAADRRTPVPAPAPARRSVTS
ncbi:MAG: O-antigen ligase family protein, partial [Acidimicrobiia bacterium]|nr:O-antigen ligase family protein [Acidimicrobiia bacterium]